MKGKTFIITGATKGMGLATSKHVLELGANVTMVFRGDKDNAETIEKELVTFADRTLFLQADITNESDREVIVQRTLEKFSTIDVLVNNAGVAAKNGFMKETPEGFDFIIDVNLKAPVFLAQLVANQMIKQERGGSIINFSSISGHRSTGGISYDAAKAGLIRATQGMANALGKYNIRVNSISPGMHKTEMNRYHWENETEVYQGMLENTPLRRGAEAAEIAGTVVYLASDQSSFVTGTDILVDGGYSSTWPGR